ncbi:uncharacterized protein LOC116251383 isoform X2 [Nymphaea colorata]|uniref:uncharacterized protein LOC116251383 isoform X2 n=1 Tax=Nymphaea colorata TaxID=210225 RepID=UPI00129DA1EC|nr:uncharacterized protein LOC116251383 isoform X2 [Nymphaea colorata]
MATTMFKFQPTVTPKIAAWRRIGRNVHVVAGIKGINSFYSAKTQASFSRHHFGRKVLVKFSSMTPVSPEELTANADTDEPDVIKMKICVSGEKTQQYFDKVFSQLVDAAQPIPGFRRVKGGKTPDIPKDILLHILGPSKVNSHVIREIIGSAVAECVEKEGLNVEKDLRVDETFEELEAQFVPGNALEFSVSLTIKENMSRPSFR